MAEALYEDLREHHNYERGLDEQEEMRTSRIADAQIFELERFAKFLIEKADMKCEVVGTTYENIRIEDTQGGMCWLNDDCSEIESHPRQCGPAYEALWQLFINEWGA